MKITHNLRRQTINVLREHRILFHGAPKENANGNIIGNTEDLGSGGKEMAELLKKMRGSDISSEFLPEAMDMAKIVETVLRNGGEAVDRFKISLSCMTYGLGHLARNADEFAAAGAYTQNNFKKMQAIDAPQIAGARDWNEQQMLDWARHWLYERSNISQLAMLAFEAGYISQTQLSQIRGEAIGENAEQYNNNPGVKKEPVSAQKNSDHSANMYGFLTGNFASVQNDPHWNALKNIKEFLWRFQNLSAEERVQRSKAFESQVATFERDLATLEEAATVQRPRDFLFEVNIVKTDLTSALRANREIAARLESGDVAYHTKKKQDNKAWEAGEGARKQEAAINRDFSRAIADLRVIHPSGIIFGDNEWSIPLSTKVRYLSAMPRIKEALQHWKVQDILKGVSLTEAELEKLKNSMKVFMCVGEDHETANGITYYGNTHWTRRRDRAISMLPEWSIEKMQQSISKSVKYEALYQRLEQQVFQTVAKELGVQAILLDQSTMYDAGEFVLIELVGIKNLKSAIERLSSRERDMLQKTKIEFKPSVYSIEVMPRNREPSYIGETITIENYSSVEVLYQYLSQMLDEFIEGKSKWEEMQKRER